MGQIYTDFLATRDRPSRFLLEPLPTAPALPRSMAVVKPGRSTSASLSRFKWEADFFDCAVLLISDYPFNPCRLLLASVFYLVIFNNP